MSDAVSYERHSAPEPGFLPDSLPMSPPRFAPPLRLPRGLVTTLLVLVVVAASGSLARRLGLGGLPHGDWAVPLGVAGLAGLVTWLGHLGPRSERVVVLMLAAVVGLLVGGWVVSRTPPAPSELRARLEGLKGVEVVSVTTAGNARCAPCATADAVVLTGASTVEEPLVSVLNALREARIAEVLVDSSTRPEEVSASGTGRRLRWRLRGVPETDAKGVLRERIVIRVVAG